MLRAFCFSVAPIITQTDSLNTVISFEYDALNRKTRKTYSNNSFAEYQHDAGVNGLGLLYKKINAHAITEYASYDAMGRPLKGKRTSGARIFDYTYDLAGRLASKAVTKDNVSFKTLNYAVHP